MIVTIIKDESLDYDNCPPFNPDKKYPEYPFDNLNEKNQIYDAVRNLFLNMGLDKENYNTKYWNPLGKIINSEDNVLIKPNLVKEYDPLKSDNDALITHGSIIRAIIDFVHIALNGSGSITIGDAPIQSANFDLLMETSGINKIKDFYNKNSDLKINLIDFRKEMISYDRIRGFKRKELKGDPQGYIAIDLKENSELLKFAEDYEKFRVTNYDKKEMTNHHNKNKNEYLISKTALNSDVIINLPKLKTHRKAGFSCSLKNIIGLNCSKDWLPHHRVGSIEENGDEYLYKSIRKTLMTKFNEMRDVSTNVFSFNLYRLLYLLIYSTNIVKPFKDPYFEGSWYGNNTISKTISDLNKIIFYADKNGILRNKIQRKEFILVDGIIGGEKEGPLHPTPKKFGTIICGLNPVAVDLACCSIMGFDYNKISTFNDVLNAKKYNIFNKNDIKNIKILFNNCKNFFEIYKYFDSTFKPSYGWKGHIENDENCDRK